MQWYVHGKKKPLRYEFAQNNYDADGSLVEGRDLPSTERTTRSEHKAQEHPSSSCPPRDYKFQNGDPPVWLSLDESSLELEPPVNFSWTNPRQTSCHGRGCIADSYSTDHAYSDLCPFLPVNYTLLSCQQCLGQFLYCLVVGFQLIPEILLHTAVRL